PSLENYRQVFQGSGSSSDFRRLLLNSTAISVLATLISLVSGVLAAYGLSRFRFRGKKNLASWILSTRMFPPVATIIPVFVMMNSLGLTDTYVALIIPYAAFNL